MCNAFIWFIEANCVAGKVKPPEKNCFHTFQNIRECWRGNVSKFINWCRTVMLSRDLSSLTTGRAIIVEKNSLSSVNACMGTEIRTSIGI